MHTGIALMTVAFIAIWAQDYAKSDRAGSWHTPPGVTFSQ